MKKEENKLAKTSRSRDDGPIATVKMILDSEMLVGKFNYHSMHTYIWVNTWLNY